LQLVVDLIAATTTKKGLKVQAELDDKHYEKGIKISDEDLAKIKIAKENFHGEWNYKISPIIV
jgi:Rhodopirellula transposase DDE domain